MISTTIIVAVIGYDRPGPPGVPMCLGAKKHVVMRTGFVGITADPGCW